MKQAHQHLEPGNTYYDHINNQVNKLVERWNVSHTRQTDPKMIGEAFKKIFEYHKWISVDDIKPSIDLGLMGKFGENKGLNSETIFKWFTGHSNSVRKSELQSHSAYQVDDTYISHEQRKENRQGLINAFMEFYNYYKKNKVVNSRINHYIPVFFIWFRKLDYIKINDDKELRIVTHEANSLRSIRNIFTSKPDTSETQTMKSMFIDAFKLAADNDYPIEEQLNEMKL